MRHNWFNVSDLFLHFYSCSFEINLPILHVYFIPFSFCFHFSLPTLSFCSSLFPFLSNCSFRSSLSLAASFSLLFLPSLLPYVALSLPSLLPSVLPSQQLPILPLLSIPLLHVLTEPLSRQPTIPQPPLSQQLLSFVIFLQVICRSSSS